MATQTSRVGSKKAPGSPAVGPHAARGLAPSGLPSVTPASVSHRRIASIDEAVAAIARGEMVIVVDDHDRENEGDFVMAADWITPDAVNTMITHGRGLVCLALTGEQADRLGLDLMVPDADGLHDTAFTVSIDRAQPPNTGISAPDRARCIRRAIASDARPDEFTRPGHVFPLRARPGGVLERRGHTEAAVDLARLAGQTPAGVICEIMNPDGTMARLPDLFEVADRFDLLVVTVADLAAHRRRDTLAVRRVAEASVPTPHGPFHVYAYEDEAIAGGRDAVNGGTHLALVHGDVTRQESVLVRLHSECLTGDVFGSRRCDCGAQLDEALRLISAEGAGVVVYLRGHEGRGIGIAQKLAAYALQDAGADTVEANLKLGFPADGRVYAAGAGILADLGVDTVRLLTNNPGKRVGLEEHGVQVTDRIPIETVPTDHNLRYLRTKRDKLGHELVLDDTATA